MISRNSALRRGVVAGLVFRAISAVTPLILIPFALEVLGKESYGVWMLATGITGLFAFADLGLGNTLVSIVGRHQASSDDKNELRRLVSTSYLVLNAVSVCLIGLLLTFVFVLPWRTLLGIPDATRLDATIILLVGFLFLINIPLGLVNRVLFGMQLVAQSYYVQAVGPMAAIVLAATLPKFWDDPVIFVLAVASGPVIASAASSIWYYRSRLRAISPRLVRPRAQDLKTLMSSGVAFFVISIAMATATAMDTLLLPHFTSLEELTDFTIVWRLFAQAGMVLSMISLPFWPIAADALAREDFSWLTNTLRKMQAANLAVMGLICVVAVLAGQTFLRIWLDGRVEASITLLMGFSCWWLLQAATYPLFMIQNAAMRINGQLVAWLAFLAIALGTKVLILRHNPEPSLLPWVSAAVYAGTLLPCALLVARRILSPSRGS